MRHLIVALGFGLLVGCSSPSPTVSTSATPSRPDLLIANTERPGETIDLTGLTVKGKTTLVEFYSDHCPPCVEMARVLEYLAAARPDLAIRRLNIDRPGHQGIDFDSPLCEQHGVQSVPSFRIFDGEGTEVAREKAAKDQVRQWYSDAQMFQRGQAGPGMRKVMDNYHTPANR